MEFKKFAFDPADGFRNTDFYEDSPSDSREILQRQHDMTRDYINSVVSVLASADEGESGSEHIGSPKIPGVEGENVYEQLSDIKRQMTDYVAGAIPDGSINKEKLADGCITPEKLSEGAVSDRHFSEGAKIGIALSAENLNGYPAGDYSPVSRNAVIGSFRERITSEKIISVKGKTCGDKRYMLQENGKIKTFHMESGELSEYLDFSQYSRDFKIAFAPDGTMYLARGVKESQVGYVYLYKYAEGEIIQLSRVKVMQAYTYGFELCDMEILNGFVYFAFVYYGDNIELVKFPLAEAETVKDSAPFYTFKKSVSDVRLVEKNGNIYCGGICFSDGDTKAVTGFCANVIDAGPENLLLASGEFAFVSEENLPEIISAESFSPTESFCFGKYLYTLKSGYIFRGRIM